MRSHGKMQAAVVRNIKAVGVDEAVHWLGVMASQASAPPDAAGARLPAERVTGTKEGER